MKPWCGLVWPSPCLRHEERLKYLHKKRRLEILIYVARLGLAVDIWRRAQFTEIKRPGINITHYSIFSQSNLLSHLNMLPE